MPHFKLEYSTNVLDQPDAKELFSTLHSVLSNFESFEVNSMKSRIIPCTDFFVSDGTRDQAFVHLELAILPGRDLVVKKEVSTALFAALKNAFPKIASEGNCSFTVEVRELNGECYSKELVGEV